MFEDDNLKIDDDPVVADGDDSDHFLDVPLTDEEKAEIAASAYGLLEEE